MKNTRLEPQISIVCPTKFNKETLEASLLSVLTQKCDVPFELIVVINEYDREALPIILKLKKQYNNIKSIVIEDRLGIAGARLAGVNIAVGKYIGFIDSDDTYCANYLQTMYSNIIKYNADIVQCNYYRELQPDKKIKAFLYIKQTKVFDSKKAFKLFIQVIRIKGYIWNKIYKKELFNIILTNNNAGIMFEDTRLVASLIANCLKFVAIPDILYNYNLHNTKSETAIPRLDRLEQHITAYKEVINYFNNTPYIKIIKNNIFWIWICISYDYKYVLQAGMPKKEIKKQVKEFFKYIKKQ